MTRYLAGIACALLVLGAGSMADTVYFKNGTTMNGDVTYPNNNAVAVECKGGRIVFPVSDVEKVEENDLKGDYSLANANPMAAQHNDELREKTGLSGEQRAEVRALVDPLATGDANQRAAARARLVAKGQEYDIYDYVAVAAWDLPSKYAPELLQALCELDPDRARKTLRQMAEHPKPVHRGAALELMGTMGGQDVLDVLARGLLADPEEVVRYSAAKGLSLLDDKRGTPALLKGLDNDDMKIQSACAVALSRIWSTDAEKVEFETADEWRRFWDEKSPGVPDPVSTKSLAPLAEESPAGLSDYG